ncbi:hypothetical protein [Furfurilactobacillus siliginis]|uniref:Uncharacterized protein n=1 Tax=Furfurilactobacillus siliginis TaxID=348151 RepID=A0A0R2L5Z2_9LACO|nr:hypothetical protein [Furfurilactobacillus siliginis]KRN97193.1 hypothetical protein IV55_GL000115 [Furfurilactobacillus siliginis]GEK28655.1 hypothetical protein LSI01_09660 [Furfurilactobacillus siliginis]
MPAYHTGKYAAVGLSENTALDLQAAGINNIGVSVFALGFVQMLWHIAQGYGSDIIPADELGWKSILVN